MNLSDLVFEPIPPRTVNSREACWLVKQAGVPVLYLTKFRNTRTDTHPYKVYALAAGKVRQDVAPVFVYPPRSNGGHPARAMRDVVQTALASVAAEGWPARDAAHRTLGLENVR